MAHLDDPTPMDPKDEARHRAEYARLIAQNRARGLGGPPVTGHSETEDYSRQDVGSIANGTWKPYKAPTRAERFWSGVGHVLGFILFLAVVSGAPIRGV